MEMAGVTERSVDEIRSLIGFAKLEESELLSTSQVVSFAPSFGHGDYRLLEVNDEILKELSDGNSFVIRGDRSEKAVLCSNNTTYEMKEAETSNSLLLLPELLFPQDCKDENVDRRIVPVKVSGIFHTYLEMITCKPHLVKLRQLLEENPYLGREYEGENPEKRYSFSELLDLVQASEEELMKGLRDIHAFLINDQWRLLDFEYKCRLIDHIINLVEENSWKPSAIPKQEVLDTLEELEPRHIVEQCIDYFSKPVKSIHGEDVLSLDEDLLCRLYAEAILKRAGKFDLREFQESWQQSVPEGMVTNLGQLKGLALVDWNRKPEVIFYYPLKDLSEDVHERFNALFKTREKWIFEDIEPYICDLTNGATDSNTLLTKYARMSLVGGVRYYSSKVPLK